MHWLILQTYCARGAWCWFATRVLLSTVRWLGGLAVLHVSTSNAIEIAVAAAGVSVLETAYRRERSLIGNLAIHPVLLVFCFVIPALAGEVALRLLVGPA